MKNICTAALTALLITSCIGPSPAFSQGTVSKGTDKSAYSYALDYCSGRGGLARYTVSGKVVKFSCSDDISSVITIHSS